MTLRVVALLLCAMACSSRDVAPSHPAVTADVRAAVVAPGMRLPAGVTPRGYQLRLEVDPDAEQFLGHVEIRVTLAAATRVIWLHARELVITGARLRRAGDETPIHVVPERGDEMIGLAGPGELAAGEVTLVLDYTGRVRSDQVGLFRQRVDEQWFVYSQGQAVFARLFVPCFDEPGFKTPWQVTLVVPAGQVALSNAPQLSDVTLRDGRHEIAFAEIGPLPSYLVAIAVGPFALVEQGPVGRNKVPFRAAVFPSDARRTRTLRTRVAKILGALETYLDGPLPWPKLDFVAVPEFFGAMENVGLVTFEAAVLLDESDGEYTFARVAAHELAHQWFGNLLTPRWWDELWLSEAFATFLGDASVRDAGEPGDLPLARQIARNEALIADAAATPVALRRAITSNVSVDDGFDTVAYQKGAAVLAMLEAFLGPPRFRDLVRTLVRDHAHGSFATQALIEGVQRVDPRLAASVAAIAMHPGTPVVDLALACAPTPKVIATARDGAIVPVCVRAEGMTERTCAVVGARTELPLATPRCPAWVNGNADGTGYYEVVPAPAAFPPAPISALRSMERLALGADLASRFARGSLTAAAAFGSVRALLGTSDPYARLGGLAILRAIDPIVPDADRAAWEAWLAKRLRPLLGTRRTRTPIELALGEAATEMLVARLTDRRVFDAAVVTARSTRDRAQADLLAGLGAARSDLAPAVVDLVLDARLPTSHTLPPLLQMLGRSDARTATWAAVRERLSPLLARLPPVDARALVLATAAQCTSTARDEVLAAFTPVASSIPDGPVSLTAALASIDRCLAVRAAVGDIVAALPR